jgi:hypothetical protein
MEGRRAHPDRREFSELLARLLAAAPDVNVRDAPAALELARGLVTERRSWRSLETLALALAALGQYQEAVGLQKEAMATYQTSTGMSNTGMAENLLRFERHEPPRMPWTTDPLR